MELLYLLNTSPVHYISFSLYVKMCVSCSYVALDIFLTVIADVGTIPAVQVQ